MALKRFRPALEDCQLALSLQSNSPAPIKIKTLLRLARCQIALASTAAASSSLRTIAQLEPSGSNAQATQLETKLKQLEGHLASLDRARKEKAWGMARLSLDKCFQSLESEGAEVPVEWRVWKVEMELSKQNWDGANNAAK
jgi:DnaJ homolog subfamily C member 7